MGKTSYQLVQDFFHQQFFDIHIYIYIYIYIRYIYILVCTGFDYEHNMHTTVQQIIHDTCFSVFVSLALYCSSKHMLLVVQMWFQRRSKHRVVLCHLGTWSTELEKLLPIWIRRVVFSTCLWRLGQRNRRCLGWSVFFFQKRKGFDWAAPSHEQMSNKVGLSTNHLKM